LYGTDLPAPVTRKYYALRVGSVKKRDYLPLLYELARERIRLRREVRATCKSITLVVEHYLLHLEVRRRKSLAGRWKSSASLVGPDSTRLEELDSDLYLLCQAISGKRVALTNARADVVREAENDTCRLGVGKVRTSGVVTSKS
jgi:hypothetical protein